MWILEDTHSKNRSHNKHVIAVRGPVAHSLRPSSSGREVFHCLCGAWKFLSFKHYRIIIIIIVVNVVVSQLCRQQYNRIACTPIYQLLIAWILMEHMNHICIHQSEMNRFQKWFVAVKKCWQFNSGLPYWLIMLSSLIMYWIYSIVQLKLYWPEQELSHYVAKWWMSYSSSEERVSKPNYLLSIITIV